MMSSNNVRRIISLNIADVFFRFAFNLHPDDVFEIGIKEDSVLGEENH